MMKRLSIAAGFAIAAVTLAAPASATTIVSTEANSACPTGLVEGKHITIAVEGEGPDIVLIPGLSSPRAVWNATVAQLKGHYRLHLVQIRGFGGDDPGINADGPVLEPMVREIADYIDDCITDQGHTSPAIIGHSLGGLTAMMIAARVPQEVSKLMVVDALPFIGILFDSSATVDTVRPQAAAQQKIFAAKENAEADERTLQIMSATDAGRAQVKAWTQGANAKVTAQLFYDDLTTDLRPEMGAITAPLLMLYPVDGNFIPPERVDTLYKSAFANAKTATLKRIDGSRHFIMLDQPEKFADEVAEFLDKARD